MPRLIAPIFRYRRQLVSEESTLTLPAQRMKSEDGSHGCSQVNGSRGRMTSWPRVDMVRARSERDSVTVPGFAWLERCLLASETSTAPATAGKLRTGVVWLHMK
jgi:hypothetical protein